jgi:hypothetical protein
VWRFWSAFLLRRTADVAVDGLHLDFDVLQ